MLRMARDGKPEGLFARVIRREKELDRQECKKKDFRIKQLEDENAELKMRIKELEQRG